MLGAFAYWVHIYTTHSTPQKAQAAANPRVGPFQTIPFAGGVVLITPSGQGNSYTAWYMTRSFWGWNVSLTSNAIYNLSPTSYNVDFESFAVGGQTFVWGTANLPMKHIIYHHHGQTFTASIGKLSVWHMILPFKQTSFPHSEWSMILPNGQTAPLFR